MKVRMMGLIGVVMLVGMLLVGMTGMAFANSVTFELSTSAGDGSITNPYDMNNSDNSKVETGSVAVGTGGTVYWQSDYGANQQTFFPTANWTITLHTGAGNNPGTDLNVAVGVYDPDTDTFTQIGITQSVQTWGDPQATYIIPSVNDGLDHDPGTPGDQLGFMVPAGDTIMLKVNNTSVTTSYQLSTSESDQSTSHYPGTENPAWPTPEIATIVMIALGVLGLGAYVWYRRRQATPVAV